MHGILRLEAKFFNISIIKPHAETEEEETVKEGFQETIQHAYDTIQSNGIKLVVGALSAGANLALNEQ